MGALRQYVKVMEASFPPDRWPAREIVDPDGGVRFVLKDGTEIHRISPPALVYDLDTGKPSGAASAQNEKAEFVHGKEEDDLLILDYEPGAGRNLGR
jgi:hypothetical protein